MAAKKKEQSKGSVQTAVVFDRYGKVVNVYSSADHEDYQERAQRLANKIKGMVELSATRAEEPQAPEASE